MQTQERFVFEAGENDEPAGQGSSQGRDIAWRQHRPQPDFQELPGKVIAPDRQYAGHGFGRRAARRRFATPLTARPVRTLSAVHHASFPVSRPAGDRMTNRALEQEGLAEPVARRSAISLQTQLTGARMAQARNLEAATARDPYRMAMQRSFVASGTVRRAPQQRIVTSGRAMRD